MKAVVLFTGENYIENSKSENAAFLVREITSLGYEVDVNPLNLNDQKSFSKRVAEAIENYSLIFFIGGMGEGFARNAKEIVCGGLGTKLIPHKPSLEKLEKLCKKKGREIMPKDMKFITVPVSARVFTDDNYAIPGFAIESAGQSIIMLPESDDIYINMYMSDVFDYLCKCMKKTISREIIRVFGLSGEQLRKTISDLLISSNPVMSIFTRGTAAEFIHIFTESGDSESKKYMAKIISLIHQRIGNLITEFDVNSLPIKVVEALNKNEFSISIAESITDGLLARYLRKIADGDSVISLAVNSLLHNVKQEEMNVSVDVIKKYPDASDEMGIAMAAGILAKSGADISLAISGGMAPDGRGGYNSTAFMALATEQGVMVEKVDLHNMSISKNQVLGILTISCLNMAYKFILGLPNSVRELNKLESLSAEDIEKAAEEIRDRKRLYMQVSQEIGEDIYNEPDEDITSPSEKENHDTDIPLGNDKYINDLISRQAGAMGQGGGDYKEFDALEDDLSSAVYYDDPSTQDGAVPLYDDAGSDDSDTTKDDFDEEQAIAFSDLINYTETAQKPDEEVNFDTIGFGIPFKKNEDVDNHHFDSHENYEPQENYSMQTGNVAVREEISTEFDDSEEDDFDDPLDDEKEKRIGILSKIFPSKYSDVGGNVFKIIVWALIVVIIVVVVFLVRGKFLAGDDQNSIGEVMRIYDKTDPEIKPSADYPTDYNKKFFELYEINPEVKAVLEIPGTDLRVPVVQAEDNIEYQTQDFYNEKNEAGNPFIDFRTPLQTDTQRIIIYGSNKEKSHMFSTITNYDNVGFYSKNPTIKLDTVYGDGQYVVFGAYVVTTNMNDNDVIYDGSLFTDINSEETFDLFMSDTNSRSIIDVFIDVEYSDKMLMLITDISDFDGARFIVVAREVRENENVADSIKSVSPNPSPIYPDKWYEVHGIEKDRADMAANVPNVGNLDETRSDFPENGAPSMLEESSENRVEDEVSIDTSKEYHANPNELETETQPIPESVSDQNTRQASSQPEEKGPAVDVNAVWIPVQDMDRDKALDSSDNPFNQMSDASSSEEQKQSSSQVLSSASELAPSQTSSMPESSKVTSSQSTPESQNPQNGISGQTFRINTPSGIVEQSVYDVVCMVVAAEMGDSFHMEALKAQAIAAYTFILFENGQGKAPYLPASPPGDKVKSAVSSVIGQKVMYGGGLAYTTYFATSAGKTNSAKDVWGGHYNYLVSVDSSIDRLANKFSVNKTFTENEVKTLVKQKMGIDLSGDPNEWFKIVSYTSGGYNAAMTVGGQSKTLTNNTNITGRFLRENVFELRSASFTVAYSNGTFTFTTQGYGHGVGMSQTGAHLMAGSGSDYKQILAHYYPGTTLG